MLSLIFALQHKSPGHLRVHLRISWDRLSDATSWANAFCTQFVPAKSRACFSENLALFSRADLSCAQFNILVLVGNQER